MGVAKLGEMIGLLNKGSATAEAAPDGSQPSSGEAVQTNALNVTRVGGVTAVVTAVGAAALALFDVDKGADDPAIVVAAFASVGLIVATALVAVAVIIAADIGARRALATEARREARERAGVPWLDGSGSRSVAPPPG